MIFQAIVIFVVLRFSDAQRISFTRSYMEQWGEVLPQFDTPANALDSAQAFTSGFVRIDTINTFYEKWTRAQVLPIGVCFKRGNHGGSAKIVQVTMDSAFISPTTQTYDTPDCSENFSSHSLFLAKEQTAKDLTTTIRHVPDIETALVPKPATSDSLIITSYLSSEGCSGEPAQYDIFITDECIMYDEPLGAFGTFQCNNTADMMVLTWFGTYVGFSSFHIACDFADPSMSLDKDAYGHQGTKQMLGCTDQSEVKDGQEKTSVFQTVRCMSGQAVPM